MLVNTQRFGKINVNINQNELEDYIKRLEFDLEIQLETNVEW